MVRLLAGGVALIACVGAASAADLPKPPPARPAQYAPKAPAYDWNGFYLGVFYGNSISQSTANTPGTGPGTRTGAIGLNDGGWSAGGTAGYNWQFAPSWLVGVEGDFGYLGGSRTFQDFNDTPISAGIKNSWFATARARMGYVTGPALLYLTAGGGWVHVTDTFGGGFGVAPASSSTTTGGAAFGGGIEVKLSRNWTNKTEYLYIDGGDHTFSSNPFGGSGTTTTFSHGFQVLRSGFNYRFDGDWDGLPFFDTPLQPTTHNWNGFYGGGHAGVGSSLTHTHSLSSSQGDEDLNGLGFAGGGTLGFNYILWQKYLIGVEGDFGALSMNHTVSDWFDTDITFSQKTNWYGTARLRAGTTTGPALLYFTGGLAWVNLQDGVLPNGSSGGLTTRTGTGWTFGGGTEVALDAHWSAKIETLYISSGTTTGNTFSGSADQFKDRFAVVRAGLNYIFN